MWVVKLGGSLAFSSKLPLWLDALAKSVQPLVVVPGGGVFADQVRRAHAHWSLDESTAHQMALTAMDQTGMLFCGLHHTFQGERNIETFDSLAAAGRVPVWLGADAVMQTQEIPHSWDVTSDSIAAWLATRIGATGLVLVKSAPLDGLSSDVEALQQADLLDPAFQQMGANMTCPVWCLHRDHPDRLAELVEGMDDDALAVNF